MLLLIHIFNVEFSLTAQRQIVVTFTLTGIQPKMDPLSWQEHRDTCHTRVVGVDLGTIREYFLPFDCILQVCSHVHTKAKERSLDALCS